MNLDGFTLPPEWAPHEATWLSWPVNEETWPDWIIKDVLHQYIQFIAELSQVEKVRINLEVAKQEEAYRLLINNQGVCIDHIEFFDHRTNDSWCRDHGPDFLICGEEKLVLNWEFNSWGHKYPPFNLDNAIPYKIASSLGLERVDVPMVLEGGAFEINGDGTLLTTSSCLLNPNRNPTFSKLKVERYLKEMFNQNEVVWLTEGLKSDDTDGHIDDITRFVNSKTILTCICESSNPNFRVLQRNKSHLLEALGNRFQIIDLPIPRTLVIAGVEVPASYANFYIANGKVIVPIFNDKNDKEALHIIQECFPDRKVVGLEADRIIYGLGSFHCLSKQEPKLI